MLFGVFLEDAHGGPPSEDETRESWYIILCDVVLNTGLRKIIMSEIAAACFKRSGSPKFRDEIRKVHCNGNVENPQQWLLK